MISSHKLMAVDEPQDDRQQNAYQNARCNREIEGDIFPPPEKITGQLSEPRNFPDENHEYADCNNGYPNRYQNFSQI